MREPFIEVRDNGTAFYWGFDNGPDGAGWIGIRYSSVRDAKRTHGDLPVRTVGPYGQRPDE